MKELYSKPFSQREFKKSDPKGRIITKELYRYIYGIELVDNDNKFGADLINPVTNDLVECEIRYSWPTGSFRFSDYTVRTRKLKYGRFDVVTINGDFTQLVIATAEVVEKYKNNIVARPNKYSDGKGEELFSIPTHELIFVSIEPTALKEMLHEVA